MGIISFYKKIKNRASSRHLAKIRASQVHNFFYQKIKNRVSSRLLAKIRVSQVFWKPIKNRASPRLLVQNHVSQVFWDPIKNRVSPRSALLEAVYLEALLYIFSSLHLTKESRLTSLTQSWGSEATPSTTHLFKRYHKMSHPPQLLVSLKALPSFASSSKGANIRLLKSVFYVKNHPNLSDFFSFN